MRFLLNTGFGRLLRFAVVGGTTGLLQLGMLQALKAAGIAAVPAYALGLLVSCQVNFTLNTFLVWNDRPMGSDRLRALVRRWTAYHACIAVAVALNFGVFVLVRAYVPDIAAAVIAILASTLVKFFSLDRLAFKDETL
jgi:putative flippase GtrA